MKYVPNMLSLSRIPLSVALLIFAMQEMWTWATVLFMVALITDALDGFIARRYNVESAFGADKLETICDLTLGAAAVTGLYVGGVIPLWIALTLLILDLLLEVSHRTSFEKLKRHTFYLHPLFFLAVVYVTGVVYISLALDPTGTGGITGLDVIAVFIYQMTWFVAGYFKRDRIFSWFSGPPQKF